MTQLNQKQHVGLKFCLLYPTQLSLQKKPSLRIFTGQEVVKWTVPLFCRGDDDRVRVGSFSGKLTGSKYRAFVMAHWVKTPPATRETQETWVWPLGREDPLANGMATHSRIVAWRIYWTEERGGLLSKESQSVRHTAFLANQHSPNIRMRPNMFSKPCFVIYSQTHTKLYRNAT